MFLKYCINNSLHDHWFCETLQCIVKGYRLMQISGRNMSIIPLVYKIWSLSILINRQISEIDKSRSQNFLWLSTLFDYNWFWSISIDRRRRSKGHTNPGNLANLAVREESRSSLCLSNVEWSKTLMKIKCQFTLLFNYFAGLDFFLHLV